MMLRNHLNTAIRALRRHSVYAAIHIAGLAIGIAAGLLIFRIVHYELGFNRHFVHADKIVRVVSEVRTAEGSQAHYVCTPIPAMAVMRETVSQFDAISAVRELWCTLTVPDPAGERPLHKFSVGSNEIAFFAEPDFVKIFSLHWLAGDPSTALNGPGSIILTRTWAEKCFQDWTQAMGKTVMIDHLFPATVTGVIDDLPDQCDFPITFIVSYETLRAHPAYFFHDAHDWGNCSSNNQVYALLHDRSDIDAANRILAGIGQKEYREGSHFLSRQHVLQPLLDMHYDARYSLSGTHRTERSRLRILSVIGILILAMACFNFINLSTAQAVLRAREVGVRKTLGSSRRQIAMQFLSETAVVAGAATILGSGIAVLTAPLLQYVSHVPVEYPFFSQTMCWILLPALWLMVTALAGLYPSLVLSAFRPVEALKNQMGASLTGGVMLRKGLVIAQFAIAQALIVAALITILQLDYIRKRDLGFDQSLIYTFAFNSDSATIARQEPLRQKLLQIPRVESVSFSSDQPLSGSIWGVNMRYGSRTEDEPFELQLKFCDAYYYNTYDIRMHAGRWYAPSDTIREAVVNMTLIRKLGLENAQDILGQYITIGGNRKALITGVFEDFHTSSLHQQHNALLLTTRKTFYWDAGVKMRAEDIPATIALIKAAYDEVLPEQVFNGNFLDAEIASFYADDRRLASTCKAFGLLAVLISCLGLFGLAAHAAAQRVKEIGIRKVLGASITGILALLSHDFIRLVLIALLIASPVAWYLMHKWLENFHYRIDIPWLAFIAAGALTVTIAFLTVSIQSLRAAMANPVNALRSE